MTNATNDTNSTFDDYKQKYADVSKIYTNSSKQIDEFLCLRLRVFQQDFKVIGLLLRKKRGGGNNHYTTYKNPSKLCI